MRRTHRQFLIAAASVAATLSVGSRLVAGALETAAGGAPTAAGGFAGFVSFLDNIATYLVVVGASLGVLGLIASAVMLISGSPEGPKWLARTVIGVGVCLLAKGIMA
jgi:hypothetical protein